MRNFKKQSIPAMNVRTRKHLVIILTVVLFLLTGIFNIVSAQIPAAMEADMDKLNASIFDAMKIIDSRSEAEALRQLESVKPRLQAQVEAFFERWGGQRELTEEEEIELGKKMLEKQLYKDMMSLVAKPSFISKIENSPALKQEYELLMNIMDMGDEEDSEADFGYEVKEVCSFSVKGAVPYSGNYSVKASSDQAFAYRDENDLFVVEISSELDGGEFQFLLLAEEAKPGTVKWSMESQVLVQSWNDEQEEVIQLSSYYYEGTITFDKIEGPGGTVTGSFQGKFFDDTQSTEDPVTVSGRFSVTRADDAF